MFCICMKCGGEKTNPWQECVQCKFCPAPMSDDLVKSVYLSVGRFETFEEREKYKGDLKELGGQLSRGQSILFDEAEIDRLTEQMKLVEQTKVHDLVVVILKLLVPAILFLLVLWILYTFLK